MNCLNTVVWSLLLHEQWLKHILELPGNRADLEAPVNLSFWWLCARAFSPRVDQLLPFGEEILCKYLYMFLHSCFPEGVLQGSILGPLLRSLYLLPLGTIFRKQGIPFHCYADVCQVSFPLKHKNTCSIQPLLDCLVGIRQWMSLNLLHFEKSETFSNLISLAVPSLLTFSLAPYSRFKIHMSQVNNHKFRFEN